LKSTPEEFKARAKTRPGTLLKIRYPTFSNWNEGEAGLIVLN